MLRAYVLIQAETGRAADVTMAVASMPGVSSVSAVNGPYDVIAKAEAADVDELGNAIVAKLQVLEGVTRTLTCPVTRL
jgi:DNA-binding Lrp family transcriptional regulator